MVLNDHLIYDRQRSLNVKVPDTISVIGVGGIGFHIATLSAMLGTKKLILFDSDVLEKVNQNRIPCTDEDIGKLKTRFCRDYISRIRPDTVVLTFPNVDEFNVDQIEGTVFICTDTIESQNMIINYCKKKDLSFIRLGYDGRHFTITNKEQDSLWSDDQQSNSRYSIVPSYVITPVFVSLIALLIFDLGISNREIDLSLDLKEVIDLMMKNQIKK